MNHHSSEHNRVVITGVGVFSSLGAGFASLSSATVESRAMASAATSVPVFGPIASYSGAIDDFGNLPAVRKRSLRKSMKLMNRETQLGVAAAYQAIQAADLDTAGYDSQRVGVCFGAGNVEVRPEDFIAGVQACSESPDQPIPNAWGSQGLPHVDPLWVLRVLPNMPACHIAIGCDYQGPNNTITQAEASANLAIQEAKHHLLDDEADAMIAGSTGTSIRCDRSTNEGDAVAGEASEGAAAFVIERLDAARNRNATIYAEVLGIGSSCVIDNTMVPKPDDAIRNAIGASVAQSHLADRDAIQCVIYNGPHSDSAIQQSLGSPLSESMNLSEWIGQVDAGSGAIGLAMALMRLAATAPDAEHAALNLGITNNGLASCLVVRNLQTSRAA
ncbi:3-oxoacyl-[acyl-carrier-protein] synthase 2 [Rosistilla carotiformis]|uniref:3-oxoacyl-[acyl-carrier-protein] synthase 2 n=1 Tax=Rosistilla carotiformis TaxID=2528017 RepID=A0A518JWQ9_9BACT|nr:beta-ketoacyl synthase N-terminal-like domain-containing protein [Rosistilla carotiformis]QDV69969.1 3-oxoacyl-[acyl-carrier-protein] synthase 2 [Rosistilla carotiformis]